MSDYTVLVLGAGASLPYGLPLGKGLVEKICDQLPDSSNQRSSDFTERLCDEISSNSIYATACSTAGIGIKNLLIEFKYRIQESEPKSIDEFLSRDFKNENAIFQYIGKRCIAQIISTGETRYTKELESEIKEHWYRYLWQDCLNRNCKSYDDVKSKKVRIISFNYDRSLEYFLARKLTSTYFASTGTDFSLDKVDKWAKEGFEAIESDDFYITHPYGNLGSLTNIPYGWKNNDRASGKEMALNINVINEDRKHSTNFSKAKEWLQEAKKVVFLGFSYDDTNMERLGLSSGLPRRIQTNQSIHSRQVFPLTYGLLRAERVALTRKYFSDFEFEVDRPSNDYSPISEAHETMQITQYLRSYGGLTGL